MKLTYLKYHGNFILLHIQLEVCFLTEVGLRVPSQVLTKKRRGSVFLIKTNKHGS